MIFLHPGPGHKDFFFIILYLRVNKAHFPLAAEMSMTFRAVLAALLFYHFTITVFLVMSKCIFPVSCINSSTFENFSCFRMFREKGISLAAGFV